jgi:DNA replication and repair protein RecF
VELLKGFLEEKALLEGLLPCPVELALKDSPEDLARAFEEGLERERHAGVVLAGPHRDDLLFSCGGRAAVLSLSRGQKRRVVTAVLLAAGRLVEAKLRLKPALLLDDVAAELDKDGRERIGRALLAAGWQVFVTGAENPFDGLSASECAVWNVRAGSILRH